MKFIFKCFFSLTTSLLIAIVPLSTSLFAQSDLISALNSNIIPLKTLSPEDDFSDLVPLGTILKDKRIVALGEATHGTKEFFDYKHRLLKYLVTELGFKTFVIEADFAGTDAMNDYVLYGKGTPYNGLKQMTIGVWFTQEFVNMVEWIKQYNSTKAFSDKVKFYGCDMQFAFNSGAAIKNGLIKLQTPLSPEAKKGLELITKWAYVKVDKEDMQLMKTLAKELENAVIIEPDLRKNALYKQYIKAMIQTIEYAEAPPFIFNKNIIRDRYMADNIEWIYNYESKSKMVVWAHNLHIAKDLTKDNNLPMGYYLTQKFSNDYYAMGFGFSSGQLKAYDMKQRKTIIYSIPDVQIKNSSDYIFKQVNVPNFILDFKTSSATPLIATFLNQKLHARAIGADYNAAKQAQGEGTYQKSIKMYDAIIFIRETNAATPFTGK